MRPVFTRILLLLAIVTAAPAAAQEVLVPIDREGRVEVVDAELATRAGLWLSEFPAFHEARLFRGPEGTFILEVTEMREGRTTRHRRTLTAAEADDVRRRVSAALASAPRQRQRLDQTGRNLLIGQTTAAGLAYYGWALPYSLGIHEAAPASGLYLLTASASFFAPFWLTADQPVTMGMANLSRFGVSRGLLHGVFLGELIAPESNEFVVCNPDPTVSCTYDDDDTAERVRAGLALVASVAEGVAGYVWARNSGMTAGDAQTVALGGDVGLATGLLGSVVLNADDGDSFQVPAAMSLAGAGLGIVGGRALSKRRAYTWGDAQLMYTGAMTGAWAGMALTAVAEVEEEVVAGAALAGGWAGLVITDRYAANVDFTSGQANLVMLSAFAGALAGGGLGALMDNGDVAAIGSAIGAIGGLALGYASFAGDARAATYSQGPVDVRINPAGLKGLLAGSADRPTGLFTASIRF